MSTRARGFACKPSLGPLLLGALVTQGVQALAHDADAGGGNEPGTRGEATGGPRPRLLFRLSSASVAGVA